MTEIVLNQIRKTYDTLEVLHGIDLHIRSGEFVVFVGPSGCGKSTLLRVIAGLEEISSGSLELDGQIVNHVPAAERGLAMVFQSYALYPHMTVYQNMAFGLENAKLPRPEIERRVHEAAEMLQITDYLKRRPKALSGGQRQRVAIGRAIVREPKAFLFDEPLSNLDAELRVAMRKELAALHAKIGGTMIYVTHDQTEAMTLADQIVVLQGGSIQQAGRPLELYNQPQHLFVAGFIGSPRMNLIPARIEQHGAECALIAGPNRLLIPRHTDIHAHAECTFGIRPEHLRLCSESEADLTARVELTEQLGGETYLYCEAEEIGALTLHQVGQLPVQRGEVLHLAVDRSQLHIFDADGRALVNGFPTAN
jgi:multiple sugar transport system ATP-binding protein